MSDRKHSVTCWVDCQGWPCQCWCHDCESDVDNHTRLSVVGGSIDALNETAPAVRQHREPGASPNDGGSTDA